MIKKYLMISLLFILAQSSLAMAQTPGSTADPLVSKSYVDQTLTFKSAELKNGATFTGTLGNQFIILSGRVRYVSKTGKELLDLTAGRVARAGSFLTLNHLYIITSNAAFELQAKTDVTLLILGISDTNLNIKP
jgi:hypothetical protein